jgi:amino acid ABC transporter membrane protein 1, PAAT family
VEVYLAVTALYVISALAVNAVMVFIEKKTRVPGLIAAGAGR